MTSPQVALVTGGAHRLGREIALALARHGTDVAISYHQSADAAADTTREIVGLGRRGLAIKCDVRDRNEVQSLVAEACNHMGEIDLLVASSGIFRRTPLAETSETDWTDHVDTNLKGAFLCAQAVGLRMRQRGSGAIVMIADVAGLRPWPSYIPYSVSKAGVIALTQGLAIELAPCVRVNAIAPGPVLLPPGLDEAATERAIARTLLRRAGSAGDVADAVLYLATAEYVTGVVLPVDGGRHLG